MGIQTPDTWQKLMYQPLSKKELFAVNGERQLVVHFLEFDYDNMDHVPHPSALVNAYIEEVPFKNPAYGMTNELTCVLSNGGVLTAVKHAFGDGTHSGTPDYTVDGAYYLGHHRVYFSDPNGDYELDLTHKDWRDHPHLH